MGIQFNEGDDFESARATPPPEGAIVERENLASNAHCGKAYKFFSLAGIMGLGIDLSFFKIFAKVLVFVLVVME